MGVALLAGWFGVSASAHAQVAPAPPGGPAAGPPPPAAAGGFPPGYPGADWCPPPPMPEGPEQPAEALPPNSFSNVHPELVGRSPRFYLGADYLLWWGRSQQTPPLVTRGRITDAVPGAAGQPGTVPVFGPGGLDNESASGGRLTAVYWFDQDHTCGVDARAFALEQSSSNHGVGGLGTDPRVTLSRPFFDPNFNAQDADPIVVPGVQAGNIIIAMPRRLVGIDANFRYAECVDLFAFNRMTLLAGGRYVGLDEKLLISEGVVDLPDANGDPGNITTLHDNFVTYNRFYGGQVGVEAESRVGPVVLTLTGKCAFGQTYQLLKVSGDTLVNDPTGAFTYDPKRGLLVQPTNNGRLSREQFGVVPEFDLNLAWEFNDHLQVSLGYTFIYWSKVVRPGDQVDPVVNVGAVGDPGQFGTSPHPLLPFRTTGFWAQGLTAGVQVSY
jgi:hypothetical protein